MLVRLRANLCALQSDDSDSSSDASSSSDSDSDSSDSDSEADLKKAANTKLPDSSSDSSSDSDSDDESDKKQKASAPVKNGSEDSSVTMGKTSPELYPPLPPDPTTTRQNNRGKKAGERPQNVPFSRVPRDIAVEDKFRSNRFEDNAHGWGAKAHEDLIVTKGKGFTKEKNKKKRGSYRGGAIDTNARNGIKFDD